MILLSNILALVGLVCLVAAGLAVSVPLGLAVGGASALWLSRMVADA